MQLSATIANTLWTASNLPSYWRFRRALANPRVAQLQKLNELLTRNSGTAFGKAHRFYAIHSYAEFTRHVPVSDYAAFSPWVERIRHGEQNILTHDPVTHLIPTSGSSVGLKLIPFTKGLQNEFNAAIGAWLVDLIRQFPALAGGPAYWSITPAVRNEGDQKSAVPIGFDADTAYLGCAQKLLAEAIMAVPSCASRIESIEAFRYQTLLYLLRCRDLRLVSVWHPSFLTLLLDELVLRWDDLLNDMEAGRGTGWKNRQRADELRSLDPHSSDKIWPELRVISCWGDAAAGVPLRNLRDRFRQVFFQPKGLIATEAFMTLPFHGRYPLAVRSHFFEFIDENGCVRGVEELRECEEYEVVVSTAGGLWRYRMEDRVRVIGWLGKTPSLQFLGRGDAVSDRFGEKLSEHFVAEALSEVFDTAAPRFALLAPDEGRGGYRYTLYVEGCVNVGIAQLEAALRRNPHYAYCRDLGQLLLPRIFRIAERGYDTYVARQIADGARLGGVKPATLSRKSGWTQLFSGQYLEEISEVSAQ